MIRYKILKLDAKKLIEYCKVPYAIKGNNDEPSSYFMLDTEDDYVFQQVVKNELLMGNCGLFQQLSYVLGYATDNDSDDINIIEELLHRFVIIDFSSIYARYEEEYNDLKDFVKLLIQGGIVFKFGNASVHMMPFDKSDSMSRQSRLSFIDISLWEEITPRLNIDIDFSKIDVELSKYYAYRGLYLSTGDALDIELNEETIIVVSDKLTRYPHYLKNVPVLTANKIGENDLGQPYYSYQETVEKRVPVDVPFDGQGFISPQYAKLINKQLGIEGATSFQIRMPFAKGMLHQVDFNGFFAEFDGENYKNDSDEPYMITDAFGVDRDLKKAHIIMTKSMYKLAKFIKESENTNMMEIYFNGIKKYRHKLFVVNTNLSYGHSRISRLSYQMLNTLDLTDTQFDDLVEKHLNYARKPSEYLKDYFNYNGDKEYGDEILNWQRAFMSNPALVKCPYIKSQLINTQSALINQLGSGKLSVCGQMRYLTRDLFFMLVRLVRNSNVRKQMEKMSLFSYRFYMPQGTQGDNDLNLCFDRWYGFLRSPHLSRNEECLLKPYVPSVDDEITKDEVYINSNVEEHYQLLNKYFGHLTGVVMVGNNSLVPMALGGADFDGDLVNVVFDPIVNDAIKSGVYKENEYGLLERTIPFIKVPSNDNILKPVPKYVSFESIDNTFSNKIGLISNAAIVIGQSEYGTSGNILGDRISCAMCTILTGLEIDAAKHGKHPDLSIIEGVDTKIAFLNFIKKYEKLRKKHKLHLNQLKVEDLEVGPAAPQQRLLILGDTNNFIKYPKKTTGTHIKKLPNIFMDNLNMKFSVEKTLERDKYLVSKDVKESGEYAVFEKECLAFIEYYSTVKQLLGEIEQHRSKAYRIQRNLELLLERAYDESEILNIVEERFPVIFSVLDKKIKNVEDIKAFETWINQQKWHLLSSDKKKQVLKAYMDFEESDITLEADVWDVVYQQRNQGYKLLWYLVHTYQHDFEIEGCTENFEAEAEKMNLMEYPSLWTLHKKLLCLIRSASRKPDEDDDYDIEDMIYLMSMACVRGFIKNSELDTESKIKALFRLTKKSVKLREIFWNVFEWCDYEKIFVADKISS